MGSKSSLIIKLINNLLKENESHKEDQGYKALKSFLRILMALGPNGISSPPKVIPHISMPCGGVSCIASKKKTEKKNSLS